jgi:hypothetical protein
VGREVDHFEVVESSPSSARDKLVAIITLQLRASTTRSFEDLETRAAPHAEQTNRSCVRSANMPSPTSRLQPSPPAVWRTKIGMSRWMS